MSDLTREYISYKHLHIRLDFCEAIYLNYKLPLTPTEAKILRLLTYSCGEPLPSGTITRSLGGNATKGSVACHICSINRKAKRIGNRCLIKNSQKIGYFLNEEM